MMVIHPVLVIFQRVHLAIPCNSCITLKSNHLTLPEKLNMTIAGKITLIVHTQMLNIWYIYPQFTPKLSSFVGKYTSPIEPLDTPLSSRVGTFQLLGDSLAFWGWMDFFTSRTGYQLGGQA